MKEASEFYEAQQQSPEDPKVWFRLGGRTLEGAREAIELAKKWAGTTGRMVGDARCSKYRIRHFVGTVETVE